MLGWAWGRAWALGRGWDTCKSELEHPLPGCAEPPVSGPHPGQLLSLVLQGGQHCPLSCTGCSKADAKSKSLPVSTSPGLGRPDPLPSPPLGRAAGGVCVAEVTSPLLWKKNNWCLNFLVREHLS